MSGTAARRCARCQGVIATAVIAGAGEPLCTCNAPLPEIPAPRSVAALASATPARRERRLVTVLFADIGGSLSLISGLDPEQADEILSMAIGIMLDAVAAHQGSIARVMGDGIMALFGAPHATEHHAARAAMAALRIRDRLSALLRSRQAAAPGGAQSGLAAPCAVRVGLNSGEVVVKRIAAAGFTGFEANGEAVHIAARMEQLATPGAILLTAASAGLIAHQFELQPRGMLAVKGLDHAVEGFELIAPRPRAAAETVAPSLPMAGRMREAAVIAAALEASARGTGQVVLIEGGPGTGKTRLMEEVLLPRRGPALVLHARAAPEQAGGEYRLIADLLADCPGLARGSEAAGAARDPLAGLRAGLARWDCSALVVPLAALLGLETGDPEWHALTPAERRGRMQDAAVALIARLDATGPLILLLEDLHRIDPDSQQVLDRLVARLPQLGLLLAASYRPGCRPSWHSAAPAHMIVLDGLEEADLAHLIAPRLGGAEAADLARRIARQAGGNPLFAEELLRHLAALGVLARDDQGCLRQVATLPELWPADLSALVGARLAALASLDARVLEAAAVIGAHVPLALLRGVAAMGPRLAGSLARLAGHGLLTPTPDGAPSVHFRNDLVREKALAGLKESRRAVLHGRLLDALSQPAPGRPPVPTGDLARHARLARRWGEAAALSRRAALAALSRDAPERALTHLRDALDALERCPDDPERAAQALSLHLLMREPLARMGRIEQMAEQLECAAPLLMRSRGWRDHGHYYVQRSHLHTLRGDFTAALGQSATAHALALRHHDTALAARARFQEGYAYFGRAAFEPAIAALDEASRLASGLAASDDGGLLPPGIDICVASFAARARAWLGRFAEADSAIVELARQAGQRNRPYDTFFAAFAAGGVFIAKGQPEAGRPWLERAAAASHGGDMPLLALMADTHLGQALVREGAAVGGVELLQAAHSRIEAMGFRGLLPHCLAALAEGLLAMRDLRAAAALAGRARALAQRQGAAVAEMQALCVLADCALAEPGGSAAATALLDQALGLAARWHLRPAIGRLRAKRAVLG
ncbi:MAG: AAA family ATPase [Rhodospirillales bacterium]|nr:AAA family ATPase [Rhodospirillales bacterium]